MKKSNRVRRVALALTVATAASIGGATAASAINTPGWWNTQSAPLSVEHYGSRAYAAGNAYVGRTSNGTRLVNQSTHKFTDADNHRPYLIGTSEWNAGSCAGLSATVAYKGVEVGASSSCAQTFYDGANFSRADGVTYTTSTWTAFPNQSAAPNNGSDRGRARVQLCIDVPWKTDKCTGYAYSPSDSF